MKNNIIHIDIIQLQQAIATERQRLAQAMQDDHIFSETKSIRIKIHELEHQLQETEKRKFVVN